MPYHQQKFIYKKRCRKCNGKGFAYFITHHKNEYALRDCDRCDSTGNETFKIYDRRKKTKHIKYQLKPL